MALKAAGKLPSGKYLERLKQSPNHNGTGFKNLSDTPMKLQDVSYWKMTTEFFKKHPGRQPLVKLPSVKTDLHQLNSSQPVIVWFGHSSYFIRMENKNFLIDPVFSGNAAPVSFMMNAFPGTNEYQPADMPPIDYLNLTHDHYDHLDYKTIHQLKHKVKRICCSLGVATHLIYWGYDVKRILELDWWQNEAIEDNLELTAAPARHFSGRGFKRSQTLWSSFILKSHKHKLYLGGDSGYDQHFKVIGEKHGPFDIAILEAGQYNAMWPYIHMMPEETVQAARDLKTEILMPVHWGKFSLSLHIWNEPIIRVMDKAHALNVSVYMPMIGQLVILDEDFKTEKWWEI